MLKLKDNAYSFFVSFVIVLIAHLIILLFLKKDDYHRFLLSAPAKSHRIDKIDFISPEDLEKIKRVGIKHGKKNLEQPDIEEKLTPTPTGTIANAPSRNQNPIQAEQRQEENHTDERIISPSSSHEILKAETLRNFSFNRNSVAAQKISNFEIRYERPEGVSEDELNSDEKAFYSFYKRSYTSYVSKLYATYEQMAVEHPRLTKEFANKHFLIGRIDYDENGNIVLVKILKSSESDDVHAFFEETLKKLNLPNPPKIFLKTKKQFSVYYQVQIN